MCVFPQAAAISSGSNFMKPLSAHTAEERGISTACHASSACRVGPSWKSGGPKSNERKKTLSRT